MMVVRLFLILGLGLPAVVLANQTVVEDVRIWAAPDNTRVVFDVTSPVKHSLLLLPRPQRLVIDMVDTKISATVAQALSQVSSAGKYIQSIRNGNRGKSSLRVVFDLKKNISMKSFLLLPNSQYGHRLVVDIYDRNAQQSVPRAVTHTHIRQSEDVIIAIDAGHGGDDPGASGARGLREKNMTLKVAKELARLINQEYGMQAVLTREGDYFLKLRSRIKKARDAQADLFVSIHADAFNNPKVKGSSVYVLSTKGASSEAARWLAEQENASDLIGGVSLDDKDGILASVLLDLSQTASLEASMNVADKVLNSLKRLGKTHKKQVQSAGFAVLKSPDIPSILVETAYISNPDEERKLRDPKYQTKLAKALLRGIKGYFLEHSPSGTVFAKMAPRLYTIVRGDTLSTIAQRYSISMRTLRQINKLKNDRIRIGQTLMIPTT